MNNICNSFVQNEREKIENIKMYRHIILMIRKLLFLSFFIRHVK